MRLKEFTEKQYMFNEYFNEMKEYQIKKKLAMDFKDYIRVDMCRTEIHRTYSFCSGYLNALYNNKFLLKDEYEAIREELFSIYMAK